MKPYAIGVDIGGTSVKLGLFSSDGTLMTKWEIPTITDNNGSGILSDVAHSISQTLAERGIGIDQVEGIGFGVPGAVDENNLVLSCVNLGWKNVDITKEMTRSLPGCPRIRSANDANAATLGEVWKGSGTGRSSAVMITLGTGVGGGVVLDGKIIPGTWLCAGEIGHMKVEPGDNTPCNCGKSGCLEQYASAKGIARMARDMLAQCDTPSPLRDMDPFTAKEICSLAQEGDPMALAIVDRCAAYLGLALSYVACTVDPGIFIVGGGMSRAGDVLLDPIRTYYRKNAFLNSDQTPIVAARLGNDAGIYGCACMVLNAQ